MHSVWLLAALLPFSLALVCPTFSCASLTSGICATKDTEETGRLSENPCPSGQFCSGQRLYEDWWWNSGTPLGSSYMCMDEASYEHTSVLDKEPYGQWPCVGREESKYLAIGTHPKECQSDDECLLSDGTYSSCLCGFRASGALNSTLGICQPHQSDLIFQDFWSQCNSENLIESRDVGFYFKVKHETYALVQASTLPCAQSVIWEFKLLQDSYAVAGGAGMIAMELIAWLSLS